MNFDVGYFYAVYSHKRYATCNLTIKLVTYNKIFLKTYVYSSQGVLMGDRSTERIWQPLRVPIQRVDQ